MWGFQLYWTLTYSSFYSYWMYFHPTFVSLVGISIEITSSAIGLKICVITAAIKKYKSIIKKKKKKHGKIVFLAKTRLNVIEVRGFYSKVFNRFKYRPWWICFKNNVLKNIMIWKKK